LNDAEHLALYKDMYDNFTPYGNYLAARCFMAIGVKSHKLMPYLLDLALKRKHKVTKPLEYAVLCYERALEKEPSMLSCTFDMAMMYDNALNDTKNAVEWYRKSLSVLDKNGCPEDEFKSPGMIAFLCNNNLGQIFNGFKDFKTSLKYYEAADRIRSTPATKSNIAGTRLAMGMTAEAMSTARTMVSEVNSAEYSSVSGAVAQSGIAENLIPSFWFISPTYMFMPSKEYLDGS
jgi:tetratricopeptide (TPR) repeat protein